MIVVPLVFASILVGVANLGDLFALIAYSLVVVVGLAIHASIVYPAAVKLFAVWTAEARS